MGNCVVFWGDRLAPVVHITRAAAREGVAQIAGLSPVATSCAKHGARLLVEAGFTVRIATATVVALMATMCSYWAQSSGRPIAPLPQAPDFAQQIPTAKSDRLDAYVREERAASALAEIPANSDVAAGVEWPLAARFSTGVHVGPRGERAYGIRIAVPVGTPVRAAADGIVDFVGNASDGYGKKVIVKHGAIRTVYAHVSEILVPPKAKVRKGQVIAKSGQSGFATSPRLYLALLGADSKVDPIAYFAKAGTIEHCAGGNSACPDRKPAPKATAIPLQERPPVPPSDIPLAAPQRAATL
jgi:hypothetical protein